ncbi:carboxypeptidase regulatory-like domain-containing protein [Natronoglycomyces albus]|uniref:Carboxypeptidase regulatory-like domain-containing protein n=1 Tax=Natronoglycomyces albus TaxID=2811108 RepID=A0A895XP32_9ACTN|nr:carboxypeptidase regulatory-like domain-containing protein [Natronoglycomyces albus]QSB05303.1 carboxypeptidase regulatory-like domain-containing protein [Natronoglycomyces albus]
MTAPEDRSTSRVVPSGPLAPRPSRRVRALPRAWSFATSRMLTAWLAMISMVLGAAIGAVVVPQAALANPEVTVQIVHGHDPSLEVGGAPAEIGVMVQVRNSPRPTKVDIQGVLSGVSEWVDIRVDGDCEDRGNGKARCNDMDDLANNTAQLRFILAPVPDSDLTDADTRSGHFDVGATGGSSSDRTSVSIRGNRPDRDPTVQEISGVVSDDQGEAVSGARVEIRDPAGTTYDTTTGGDGAYRFEGNDDRYIAPGQIDLRVTADGFEDFERTIQVGAGAVFVEAVSLSLPEDDSDDDEPPAEEPTEEETTEAAVVDDGVSGMMWLIIILGILLVLGGIAAIVIMIVKSRKDDDEGEDGDFLDEDVPPDHTPKAAQTGQPGVYDSGPAPGADQPTMIHDGPLLQDDDLARYGSQPAGGGFGPAYGPDDATQLIPSADGGLPSGAVSPGPGADATQIVPMGGLGRGGPPENDSTQIIPTSGGAPGGIPPAPPAPYGSDPAGYGSSPSSQPRSGPPSPYGEPSRPEGQRGAYGEPSRPPYSEPSPPGGGREPYGSDPYGGPRSDYGGPSGYPQSSPSAPPSTYGSDPYGGTRGGDQGDRGSNFGFGDGTYGAPSEPRGTDYGAGPAQPSNPWSQPASTDQWGSPSAPESDNYGRGGYGTDSGGDYGHRPAGDEYGRPGGDYGRGPSGGAEYGGGTYGRDSGGYGQPDPGYGDRGGYGRPGGGPPSPYEAGPYGHGQADGPAAPGGPGGPGGYGPPADDATRLQPGANGDEGRYPGEPRPPREGHRDERDGYRDWDDRPRSW